MPESEQETRPQVTLETQLVLAHLRMNTISPQAQERITRALEPLQVTATCPEIFEQVARPTKPIPQELLGIR